MKLRFVTATAIEDHPVTEAATLLKREDGYVWLDVPQWSEEARDVLGEVFGFHPVALQVCRERNHMPMVHGYADHIFVVLHRPMVQVPGHAHLLELDQFIGARFLVTVHGPANPVVPHEALMQEVNETVQRMEARRIWPETPTQLAHALISLIALRQRVVVQDVARRVAALETQVMGGTLSDPESSLEEMFKVRHELLTVRTMASHSTEVLARMHRLVHVLPIPDDELISDLEDMFQRVHRMTDGEQEFLTGVIDLFRSRTDTKMMIAGERLAVLAALTLPITAISSIYGMNVIVNAHTHVSQLVIVLVIMAVISGLLLRWTKRQGWW